MLRKVLVAVVVGGSAIALTMPAIANTDAGRAPTHDSRLFMTAQFLSARTPAPEPRSVAVASNPATLTYQGYSCEVTVGVGTDDQTPKNFFVTDSTEFYIAFKHAGATHRSVTSNCVGQVPPGTTISHSIVSHTVACTQLNPFNRHGHTIQGWGISTTYPDGLYSETCNTPNLH
jgi:hypothetical protein